MIFNLIEILISYHGESDIFTEISVLSKPVDTQDVSCLGLHDRDICPKIYVCYGQDTLKF